jgi:hypothetical protein
MRGLCSNKTAYRHIDMAPKHVLVLHRPHNFIVNVQPSFLTTAVSVRMGDVDRIMPAACGFSLVKHPTKLVSVGSADLPETGKETSAMISGKTELT